MTRSRQTADWGSRAGLAKVIPSSVAVGSGTGSADSLGTVTFSGSSSVSLNGIFSSTYTNYRVLFNATNATSNSAITMRMRASGSDATGSNYYRAGTFNYNNSATVSALNASGTSFALVDILSVAPNRSYLTIELSQPNNAVETMLTFYSAAQNSTSMYAFQGVGLHDLTTAYDGFTLSFSANSSGIISVYGYTK